MAIKFDPILGKLREEDSGSASTDWGSIGGTLSDQTDLQSALDDKLENIVEDTTPQLGGELNADGNNIIDLADITFKTGAIGGTVRTGTSAADKFELQAYDVNGGFYQKVLEVDANNEPTLEVFSDTFRIWDSTDETKQVAFDNSNITTGQTRTFSFPDESGTLALTSDIPSVPVDSVNTQTGAVVLDADDIDDTSTTHKFVTATDITKLGNTSGTNSGDITLGTNTATALSLSGQQLSLADVFVQTAGDSMPGDLSIAGDITLTGDIRSIGTSTNHSFDLKTNDTLRYRIRSDGVHFLFTNTDNYLLIDETSTLARIYTDASSGTPRDLLLGTYPNGNLRQLFLQQSTGNVGIGTDSPPSQLSVITSSASKTAISAKAASSQTADVLSVVDSSNSNLFRVDANGMASSPYQRGLIFSQFADDTAISVTVPTDVNGGMLLFYLAKSGTHNGILTWRTGSSPYCTILVAQSDIETSTSVLTGTTGTDGKITISATGGTIYVENRTGSSQTVRLTLLI